MTFSVNALIVRTLTEQDGRFLFAFPYVLFNDTEKVWISFIKEYVDEYKRLPVLDRFQMRFPTFRVEETNPGIPTADIFNTIIPIAQENYLSRKIQEDVSKGKTVWEPTYFQQLIADTTPSSTDILKFTELSPHDLVNGRKLYDWGDSAKWMEKMLGKLDHKDFVIIAGKAKSAKTTVLSIIAVSLFRMGYNLLIFNNELDKFFMAGKILAILKKFNPNVFRTLEFTEEILTKFEEFQQEMTKYDNQIYIQGRIKSTMDIVNAYNNCEKKPDIILIDAFNNIGAKTSSNQSEQSISLGNMAQFCRDFVNDYAVPIITTCQLNRTSGDSNTPSQDAIGGSIEIIRQADQVVTTTSYNVDPAKIPDNPIGKRFKQKYPNTEMPFFYLNTMVSRHGGTGAYCIHLDWENMQMMVAEPSLLIRDELMDKEFREEVLREIEDA